MSLGISGSYWCSQVYEVDLHDCVRRIVRRYRQQDLLLRRAPLQLVNAGSIGRPAMNRQDSNSTIHASEAPTTSPPNTIAGPHRVTFNLQVLVHGCCNIPHQTNSRVYCKWKLPGSLSVGTAHAGVLSPSETTAANLVVWDASIELPGCVFKVDRATKLLKSAVLRLSVRQESRLALKGFTRLGVVQMDLADFAGQTTVDRTYLLEKSRLNSTLSVTVSAEQVGGDVMFRRRSSSTSACSVDEDIPPGNRLSRRMKLPSGVTISTFNSAQSASTHLPSSSQSSSSTAAPHTIYQVVGDVLRISEENRLSRNSSLLDATQQ